MDGKDDSDAWRVWKWWIGKNEEDESVNREGKGKWRG